MRVFVYEFVTGGGWWSVDPQQPPSGSLLAEGRAMLTALATDFAQLPDVQVCCLADSRLGPCGGSGVSSLSVRSAAEEQAMLCDLSRSCDWSVIIAPEISGHLLRCVRLAERAGGRLLSPDSCFVELAANKQATAQRLRAMGIPVPDGELWHAGTPLPCDLPLPWVVKPVDGAGSIGVRLINAIEQLSCAPPSANPVRVEQFRPGVAASIAMLCGPAGHVRLPPARQILSDDGHFLYCGGEVPLTRGLAERADQLADAVAKALPATTGFVGLDLVLAEQPDGSGDCVIEVNPRLTTSYIGLRELAHENLAAAMLAAARGERCGLSFRSHPIRFTAG